MKRSHRFVLFVAVPVVLMAVLLWAFAPRPIPVEVQAVVSGTFEQIVEEEGRTRVRDRYVVSAPLAGRMLRLDVREGDAVDRNEVLVRFLPTLPAMLDARTSQELAARAEAADALMAQAKARVAQAKIAWRQAKLQQQRSETLQAKGFVSATQLEIERMATQAADKELLSAQESVHVAEHERQQARAALAAIRDPTQLSEVFQLRAPVNGKVLRVLQQSESTVVMGTPLLEIGDTREMEIVTELLTTDAIGVRAGMPVRIENWGGKTPLQGQVRLVEPGGFTKVSALGVEEQRVTTQIDILSPPEQWQALGDGYGVAVKLVVLSKSNTLLVPLGAVFPMAGSGQASPKAVFVFDQGRARLRPIKVIADNGVHAWIGDGLKLGEQVVLYPGDAMKDGVRVKRRVVPVRAR